MEMLEILRNGDPEKSYIYFICEYCGCEFKVPRGAYGVCPGDINIMSVSSRCPCCGDYVSSMPYDKYKEVRAK